MYWNQGAHGLDLWSDEEITTSQQIVYRNYFYDNFAGDKFKVIINLNYIYVLLHILPVSAIHAHTDSVIVWSSASWYQLSLPHMLFWTRLIKVSDKGIILQKCIRTFPSKWLKSNDTIKATIVGVSRTLASESHFRIFSTFIIRKGMIWCVSCLQDAQIGGNNTLIYAAGLYKNKKISYNWLENRFNFELSAHNRTR